MAPQADLQTNARLPLARKEFSDAEGTGSTFKHLVWNEMTVRPNQTKYAVDATFKCGG